MSEVHDHNGHAFHHKSRLVQASLTLLVVLFLTFVLPKLRPSTEPVPVDTKNTPIENVTAATSTIFLHLASSTPPEALVGDLFPVTKVVDGDTIDVAISSGTARIRLIGINTPESVDPRRPVQCFGKEASNHLKEVLTDRSVRLLADASQDDKDKYGRLLRYVFRDDGLAMNAELVWSGFAQEYTYKTPHRFQKEFRTYQAEAQSEERGLWAPTACGGKK